MISKFSFGQIVRDHFDTFRLYPSDKKDLSGVMLYLGLPAVWAICQNIFSYHLSETTLNMLITAASIFAGLLLNLLVLLYTGAVRMNADNARDVDKKYAAKKLLIETLSNVSFSILVSIFLVVACLLFHMQSGLLGSILEGSIYFLSALLVLSILMDLKRIHALLTFELDRPFV